MKKIFYTSFLFLIFLLIMSTNVLAGEQQWNSLNYDVTLDMYGNARIVETWDVYISETNTMFKDFDLYSQDNRYDIRDVSVSQIVNGTEKPLNQIYEEQYHVDSGCYYGLMKSGESDVFEIAWNVGLDDSSDNRVYKISYMVDNAVKIYNDCAEFYWKFLSKDNVMTGENITGTIHLPSNVSNIEKLHVWGHGDLNGITERTSTNRVDFSMDEISSNTMLELRVVSEENLFEYSLNTFYEDKLDSILAEEKAFADDANAKRVFFNNIKKVVACIVIILFLIYLKKILRYIKQGKELKANRYPESELQYFRDIPNEKEATPARAAYMYYFKGRTSNLESYTSNIFSATILNLTLKKYISLEPDGKDNIIIHILNKTNDVYLSNDEEIIYNLLIENIDETTNTVDSKTLEKYAKKNYSKFYKKMNEVCKLAREYYDDKNAVDKEKQKLAEKWASKGAFYLIGIFMLVCFAPLLVATWPIALEFLIATIICFKNAGYISVLYPEYYAEHRQWLGLKKYMIEFSLLKEKEVPDLILWEKYLVYATTFGVSKKVLDQLVKVYPQMTESDFYRNGNYTYMYIASNSGFDALNSLDTTFSHICQTANSTYSSATGSGGGFSGGGGGRRWWWKLWWKINKLKET